MQYGHCPHCTATTIRSNTIALGGTSFGPLLTATVYVCMKCGYTEWYVPPELRGQLDPMIGWNQVAVKPDPQQAYTGATQRLDPSNHK